MLLPLGISFFTFQQLSFLIDSYYEKTPVYPFADYALFVTFFPQLIAGPIVLHSEVIPQFMDRAKRKFNSGNFARGIYTFALGLSKKVLLADNLGKIVTFAYSNVGGITGFEALLAVFAYTFQIYFDFSGYCDMASGIADMFNITLPINFNSPYKAKNIADFWKRWHMTLTRFLTNYIYIPLGGSRCARLKCYGNILIVFLVSGIWHGAGYTFIVWGLLHGIAMILYRAFKKYIDAIPSGITWLLTFVFVSVTWVVFRAETLTQAIRLLSRIGAIGTVSLSKSIGAELAETLYNIIPISIITNILPSAYTLLALMAVLCLLFTAACVFMKNTHEKAQRFVPTKKNLLTTYFLLAYSVLSLSGVSVFLYFNF